MERLPDLSAAEPVAAVAMEAPPSPADEPLNCPLCDYDLRGLPENRCPECGHAFDPVALMRARQERRDWLFEHAQRRRVAAFLKTVGLSLFPVTFWSRLSPAQPINPRRLKIWACLWLIVPLALLLGVFSVESFRIYREAHQVLVVLGQRGRAGPQFVPPPAVPLYARWGMTQFTLIDAVQRAWTRFESERLVSGVALFLWVPVSVMSMKLFGMTLRRAGIRSGHLWRCTLYALPSALLLVLAGMAITGMLDVDGSHWLSLPVTVFIRQFGVSPVGALILLAAIALTTIHLVVAHVRYLRLPHAVVQALLVQTVSWLAILTGLLLASQK